MIECKKNVYEYYSLTHLHTWFYCSWNDFDERGTQICQ